MRNHRARALLLTLVLLPGAAQAALTPVGEPLAIVDEFPCSYDTNVGLEVTATPKGAFEVVWTDESDFEVKGRRFDRGLNPGGPPLTLLPLHGGLFLVDPQGTWAAGRYELVMNGGDFDSNPGDPAVAYRVTLDLDGEPLAPPARQKPRRFLELAPAANGDSLQLRSEPPLFGPPTCRSVGALLASRVDTDGTPLSAESRVTRKASAWNGSYREVDRRQDDTFVLVYETCQRFTGLVARSLTPAGKPVGSTVNLPLPGRIGNYANGKNLALAARAGTDFVAAAMVADSVHPEINGLYTTTFFAGQRFSPTRVPTPPGFSAISGVADFEASPDGRFLLLFYASSSDRTVLFAQEIHPSGSTLGDPVALTGDEELGRNGAIAALPDGRWIVVTRARRIEDEACIERLKGTVLRSDD